MSNGGREVGIERREKRASRLPVHPSMTLVTISRLDDGQDPPFFENGILHKGAGFPPLVYWKKLTLRSRSRTRHGKSERKGKGGSGEN